MTGTWCIPNAPKQNGDLWVEVTESQQVKIMSPAGTYWRDRVFATVADFQQFYLKATK